METVNRQRHISTAKPRGFMHRPMGRSLFTHSGGCHFLKWSPDRTPCVGCIVLSALLELSVVKMEGNWQTRLKQGLLFCHLTPVVTEWGGLGESSQGVVISSAPCSHTQLWSCCFLICHTGSPYIHVKERFGGLWPPNQKELRALSRASRNPGLLVHADLLRFPGVISW